MNSGPEGRQCGRCRRDNCIEGLKREAAQWKEAFERGLDDQAALRDQISSLTNERNAAFAELAEERRLKSAIQAQANEELERRRAAEARLSSVKDPRP